MGCEYVRSERAGSHAKLSARSTLRLTTHAKPRARATRICACPDCGRAPTKGRAVAPAVRFWLPPTQRFAYVALDFHPEQARFSLRCYRRNARRELELVNAVPNSYRLRELEATLVELHLALPTRLRRYLLAVLGEDGDERRAHEWYARELLCCGAHAENVPLERAAS